MLSFATGEYSSAGRKPVNQDAVGAKVPAEPLLSLKGAAFAVADGVSSSQVSDVASHTAVNSFSEDYFHTADGWSVNRAARAVIQAISARLYARTRNGSFEGHTEKGYVCTFSALLVKQAYAYLFHAGDSRIYRLRKGRLSQLTRDHRVEGEAGTSCLSNALGMEGLVHLEEHIVQVQPGDLFVLLTDGIHEWLSDEEITQAITQYRHDLPRAARHLGVNAYNNGSADNMTALLVGVSGGQREGKIDEHPDTELPVSPVLTPGQMIDGYHIQRHLYASARSHIYVVEHQETLLALKAPSVEQSNNAAHLECLMMEEWVARRVQNQHLLSAPRQPVRRSFCYTIAEYLEGQTLAQWLRDNPTPALETVRDIVEQVARGLMALHRRDVLHRDIRPENIMINATGLVKLIDFGSASVAGVVLAQGSEENIPGTAIYAAPEYFLGDCGSPRSDQFSLAVLAYYMLAGDYPYASLVARCGSVAAQHKLKYKTVLHPNREIPFWVDNALQKALRVNPQKRYSELSEFMFDLRHPNPGFVHRHRPALIHREPVLFWQGISGVLLATIIWLFHKLYG